MTLQLGDTAPDFEAETTEGPIRFHDWIGDSWAVLFSHPKDFTPVCTTELGYMAKIKPEFDRRGVKIIGLSVDPVDKHDEVGGRHRGDPGPPPRTTRSSATTTSEVSKAYGMLPADVAGDPAERTPADNQTVRNVFVIGPDKKIKLVLVYPMTTGRNFDEVLRVIDSLQLTAKHKVATPANWKQGDDVIIAGSRVGRRRARDVPRRLGVTAALHPDRSAARGLREGLRGGRFLRPVPRGQDRRGGPDAAEAARRAAAGDGFVWVAMHDPDEARLTEVAHAFELPWLAVENAARPGQRPKAESFGDVLVVTVQTVRYVDTHEVVETGQIVVFVARLGVVSVRSGPGRTVAAAREQLEGDPERLARGPMAVVHAILDQVVDDYEPVLDGVRHDIEAVEERVFAARRDNPALRIYHLEREMIYFGRAVTPLLEPVEHLARGAEGEGDEAEPRATSATCPITCNASRASSTRSAPS